MSGRPGFRSIGTPGGRKRRCWCCGRLLRVLIRATRSDGCVFVFCVPCARRIVGGRLDDGGVFRFAPSVG